MSAACARLLRSVLMVGAASAALSLAGPDALVPFKDAAADAATVGVAFVIDLGSGAPVVGCVHVPPSDNGYYALAAFAQQENLAAPTYAGSGLLCSIGGIPATGCGTPGPNGHYYFWSYWNMTDGSGRWTYSDRGAFTPVGDAANGQDVEGWRFQNPGPDNSNAPPPRAAPDYAAICPAASVPSPASPSATSPTATAPPAAAPSSGGAVGGHSTGTGAPAGSTVTTPPVTAPTSHAGTTDGGHPSTTAPRSATGRSTTTVATSATAGHTQALGAPRRPTAGGGSGGSVAPLVIGGALVVALAGAAGWRWRRRPRTS
ncbi:MAG: hypothetical protein WB565_06750 [Acidimicrobiales bacterium]